MKTINDYMAMIKELRDLGQALVQEQYTTRGDVASWVEELERMDLHLECCEHELIDCGVEY